MSGGDDQAGFATTEYVLAAGLALVFFTLLANLVVMQYTRGVLRAAADEGARRGAVYLVGDVAACEEAMRRVLDDLAGGPLISGVELGCVDVGRVVRARAEAVLRGWLPGVPDLVVRMESAATRESP